MAIAPDTVQVKVTPMHGGQGYVCPITLPAYQAAEKGYIDDVIEPRNTRFRVIRALEQLAGKKQQMPAKKHDNLPL